MGHPRVFASRSEAETMRIAGKIARVLRGGETILLSGELGVGKTVFVRGLAKGLGIRGRITSPTFVLMRVHQTATSYQLQATSRRRNARLLEAPTHRPGRACSWRLAAVRYFVHVDAYRIRDFRELEAIGLDEWIGRPDTVVAIEWGERVVRLLHASHRVTLASSAQRRDARRITITRRTQMQRVHK